MPISQDVSYTTFSRFWKLNFFPVFRCWSIWNWNFRHKRKRWILLRPKMWVRWNLRSIGFNLSGFYCTSLYRVSMRGSLSWARQNHVSTISDVFWRRSCVVNLWKKNNKRACNEGQFDVVELIVGLQRATARTRTRLARANFSRFFVAQSLMVFFRAMARTRSSSK